MSTWPVSFENDKIAIVNRDDGLVSIEFRDEDGLSGIASVDPATAVNMGQILVAKGNALMEAQRQAADQATVGQPAPVQKEIPEHINSGLDEELADLADLDSPARYETRER